MGVARRVTTNTPRAIATPPTNINSLLYRFAVALKKTALFCSAIIKTKVEYKHQNSPKNQLADLFTSRALFMLFHLTTYKT
jgi:hypothetical protein